eukprot:5908230-Prymnesium_polylepis.1
MAQPRLPLRDRARAPQLRLEQPLRVEWAEPGPVVHATTVLAADENARNARAASARAQPRAECGAVGLEIKLHHRIRRLLCVEQLLGALPRCGVEARGLRAGRAYCAAAQQEPAVVE